MSNQKPSKKPLNKYIQFSGAAIQMGVTIFVGTYLGSLLDDKYPNERNLFTLIFTLVFVFISLYLVIKQVSKISNTNDK